MKRTRERKNRNKPPNTYTDTRLRAFSTQLRNLDAELGLVGRRVGGSRVVVRPGNQGRPDDGVRRGIDDADIREALMGNTDPNVHIDDVAGLVLLHMLAVVRKLISLAEPQVALLWIVTVRQTFRISPH